MADGAAFTNGYFNTLTTLGDLTTNGEWSRFWSSPEVGRVIDAVDGFFAGIAHALTAGLTTRLRTAMYGDLATRNHQGFWFNVGVGVGTALSMVLGFANPCGLSAIGQIGLRTLNGLQAVGGVWNAVENIQNGNYLTAGFDLLGVTGNLFQMFRACFTGEMQVRTKGGWVRWDSLRLQDEVLSCDETNPRGELTYKPVTALFRTTAAAWHVHVKGHVIRTTSEHPFYVWGKDWLAAKDLQPGDLLRSDDGRFVAVEEVL